MYTWVLPTELTAMNALANIGGGLGLACSGVLAGLMIDAGYSWKTVYYVDTVLMAWILEQFRLGFPEPNWFNRLEDR